MCAAADKMADDIEPATAEALHAQRLARAHDLVRQLTLSSATAALAPIGDLCGRQVLLAHPFLVAPAMYERGAFDR